MLYKKKMSRDSVRVRNRSGVGISISVCCQNTSSLEHMTRTCNLLFRIMKIMIYLLLMDDRFLSTLHFVSGYKFKTAQSDHNFHHLESIPCKAAYHEDTVSAIS